MREIKYRKITAHAEDGRVLPLAYFVLIDKSQGLDSYGAKVVEERGGEAAQAIGLTTNTKAIYDLVDKLAKHAVTPTTLSDVVADWREEERV